MFKMFQFMFFVCFKYVRYSKAQKMLKCTFNALIQQLLLQLLILLCFIQLQ